MRIRDAGRFAGNRPCAGQIKHAGCRAAAPGTPGPAVDRRRRMRELDNHEFVRTWKHRRGDRSTTGLVTHIAKELNSPLESGARILPDRSEGRHLPIFLNHCRIDALLAAARSPVGEVASK